MYIIIESEVKLSYTGELEYLDTNVIACNSREEGIATIQQKKNEAIERGYFTKVISETENRATLYNGGTAYKDYRLICRNR